jgi:photosystem II stability/assembly factor-like uncharacterized protein
VEFVVGTTEGIFLGESGRAAEGVAGRGVRHLFRAGDHLFAAAADGVYRSADGGQTWARTGVDAGEVWNVVATPHDSRRLYASTQPAHLFTSQNGGDTWQEVTTFLEAPGAQRWCVPNSPLGARALALAFDPFDAQRFWVGVEVGGVVATEDCGVHWSVCQPGGNADIHLLAAHPQRAGMLFATTGYGRNDDAPMEPRMAGPYRSMDGGASWQYLGETMQPHYTRAMCVDPRPPFALTVPAMPDVRSSVKDPGGAQAVLFRSDDDGATWRSLGDQVHSPSSVRLTAVTPDPDLDENGSVLVGTETGEVWRVGPDATWAQLSEGLPPVQALLAFA